MAYKTGGRKPLTFQLQLRGGVEAKTLAGTLTLDEMSSTMLKLDPGGAGRNVQLPAGKDGLVFYISNAADAAEALTVKDAAAATVATISQNEAAWLGCTADGDNWIHLGIQTIALT